LDVHNDAAHTRGHLRETMMLQRHHNNHRADSRQLSPQQWAALEQDAARRAGAARTQAMRERLGRIADAVRAASASGRGLGRAMVAAGTATMRRSARAYATWRERRRAIGALGSLSDLALKDMGIYRCQIESLVYGLHREEWIAARPPCEPRDRQTTRRAAAANVPSRWIEKDAA
jgi:uncharacterized protein YjiS (DUF1127 family)